MGADLLKIFISVIGSMIQIVVWPINQFIVSVLPNLNEQLSAVVVNISNMFVSINWGLGVLPFPIIATLLFIISVEIARHTIFVSTHVISLVFDIIKKIKFW